MCAVPSAWIEEQTNETVDYMSGLAGFPKNTRHTVFSVRSLWSRCVTICSGRILVGHLINISPHFLFV